MLVAWTFRSSTMTLVALSLSGCLHGRLGERSPVNAVVANNNLGSDADLSLAAPARRPSQEERPTIYALDQQTFRFQLPRDEVWEAAMTVLLKNYNLNIVDSENGIITTEWDTFFLQQSVYRNKVSLRVRPISRRLVDVTIHNNVEKLQDGSQAGAAIGAVWLPSADVAAETARLVQNMSTALNQAPPVIPSAGVAKSVTLD